MSNACFRVRWHCIASVMMSESAIDPGITQKGWQRMSISDRTDQAAHMAQTPRVEARGNLRFDLNNQDLRDG